MAGIASQQLARKVLVEMGDDWTKRGAAGRSPDV